MRDKTAKRNHGTLMELSTANKGYSSRCNVRSKQGVKHKQDHRAHTAARNAYYTQYTENEVAPLGNTNCMYDIYVRLPG